jgi:SAM-dependent methyltransferase
VPESETSTAEPTANPSSGLEFGVFYYAHDCGIPYERNDYWLGYFDELAGRLARELNPGSVLDAGCALGMLVEGFRKLGVDAHGIDISEYAIANTDPAIREFVTVGSLVDPITEHYDLITCIEVLEHLEPADAYRAMENLCGATDQLLFCSTPFDLHEPTHVNVKPPEDWAAALATHGFTRDFSFDATFIAPWAALYRRSSAAIPDIVRSYERSLWRLRHEVGELRRSVLTQQHRLERQQEQIETPVVAPGQVEILTLRDELIGAHAELGEALGEIARLEAETLRYQRAAHELNEFRRAPVWRLYEPYQRIRSKVGSKVRAFLARVQ